MRDGDRAAERAAEGIEVLGRLAGEAVGIGVERVVLEVLEQAAVELVAAALGGEGDVADLRELGAVVEGGDLDGGDAFLRGIGVLQRAVLADVGRGDAVDGEVDMEELAPPRAMLPELSCCTLAESASAPSGLVVVARLFSGSCVMSVLSLESLSVALSVLIWSAAAVTFDGDRVGGDCERGVEAEILAGVERDAADVGGREAGACDRDTYWPGLTLLKR